MPYNNQRLINAAEAAFGLKWRRPLAKAMGEHQTQVQRWALGLSEVSDDKLQAALDVCSQHLRETVEKWIRSGGGKI